MDLGALFLILAVLLLVGWYISRPFFAPAPARSRAATAQVDDHRRSALLAERDRLLNALQELDFDNAVGKIPPEDYPIQRAGLLQAGAEILRQLDELEQHSPRQSAENRFETAAAAHRADATRRERLLNAIQQLESDAQAGKIEQEVFTSRRSDLQRQLDEIDRGGGEKGAAANSRSESSERKRLPAADQDDLEALISARRRDRKEKAAGFCPRCGRPLQKSDQFCSSCGAKIG